MTRHILLLLLGAGLLSGTAAAAEVLAARPLPRGTVLTLADLEGPGGAISILAGQQLTRPVFADRAITPADVEAPDVVHRQSEVMVAFRRGGLSLTTTGRAMKGGATGDLVPIRLEGARETVTARVSGPGVVEVGP